MEALALHLSEFEQKASLARDLFQAYPALITKMINGQRPIPPAKPPEPTESIQNLSAAVSDPPKPKPTKKGGVRVR